MPRQHGRRASRVAPTRMDNMRNGLQQLFTGRSTIGTNERRNSVPETPKTPRLPLGLQSLPTTRLVIPHLNRSATSSTDRSPTTDSPPSTVPPPTLDTSASSQSLTPNSLRELQRALGIDLPPPTREGPLPPFVGVDPEEQHLAELAVVGRRRRRSRRTSSAKRKCVPNMKNRKIRSKVMSCFFSGFFLITVLAIYLALALSNRNLSQEFHVLLILIILVTTIFFCHALISLCLLTVRAPSDDEERPRMSAMVGPGGYANPPRPIRIALARDEEAVGIENDATKFPPPAYGLWRESVRVDPNRIFWQRNEVEQALTRQNSIGHASQGVPGTPRPPSYISEEGVDYVIEAVPRSIAPTTDVPLRQHPSELGRLPPGCA